MGTGSFDGCRIVWHRGRTVVAVPEVDAGEMMNTREVAELCGVSEQTVRRWRFDGDLPYFRLGYRTIRYRRNDVDALLAARTVHNRFVTTRPQSAPRPVHRMTSVDDD